MCRENLLDAILSNLYLSHRLFKKNGINYENFDGSKKITFSHYLTLMLLKKRGTLPMSKIRMLIGINKQNMTYITDALVEKGFIKRVPNINDRRMINVVITDNGDKYLNKWQKNKIKEINKILSVLDTEDLRKLHISIENIKNIILKIND